MANPLFSTYRQGENRVTSTTLAVFERIDLALVQDLLNAASEGADLQAVTFENQLAGSGNSVPDAKISANFTWWFETKTVPGEYVAEGHARRQVREHAELLADQADACLFILTPDPARPSWFTQLDGIDDGARERVLWLSFRRLADEISELLSDPARVVGEQTRFLLSELVALYEMDGLLSADDTVIVAAARAWPAYHRTGAYVCQANRAFREGLTHLGFYADGSIQPLVARIKERHVAVPFTSAEARLCRAEGRAELGDVIEARLVEGDRSEGEPYDVFLLSAPNDPDTVDLGHSIKNDSGAGAWTQKQRYTSLKALRNGATITSQL